MFHRTLEDYLNRVSFNGGFISHGRVRVEKISKVSGGISNDVRSLLVVREKEKHSFILRMYDGDSDKAGKEHEILRALEGAGFPVPHVYLCEKDSAILGKSFIIMDEVKGRLVGTYIEKLSKEEKEKRTWEIVELLAETLAKLHRSRWKDFNLTRFHPPKDEYDYAERQSSISESIMDYIQHELHGETKEDLSHAIAWLQKNAESNPCERHSIVHGDYCPDNIIVTDDGRIIVIDWEGAEIGDPVVDVGYAYHFVRLIPGSRNAKEGEELAEHFVTHYQETFGRAIGDRLEFYKVAAALKLAIFLRLFMRPRMVLKSFGLKWILLYPLFYWFLRSLKNYMENFVEEPTA